MAYYYLPTTTLFHLKFIYLLYIFLSIWWTKDLSNRPTYHLQQRLHYLYIHTICKEALNRHVYKFFFTHGG